MKATLKLALLLAICTMSVFANAQSTRVIKGVLIDSISGQPESFATVYLFPQSQDAKPLQSIFTDEKGVFVFKPVKAGTYRLRILSIARKPINRSITVGTKDLNLDTIRIADASNQLAAVTVTAQRPLIKAEVDKISYQISDDPESKTSSTLEMLRKVPMVTVDGEDNIQVNGSSSFKVYVNGKPNQMMSSNPSEIFKNYPASAIKKMEVITNPGAKYDAEGVAGVLNIITEGDVQTNGYSVTPSININSHGYRGSFFGIAQFGKLMLSAHYGIGHNSRPASESYSEREVFADPVNHYLRSEGSGRNKGTFQWGSLEASYEFDKSNLLSISAGLHGWSGKNTNSNTFSMLTADEAPVYSYMQQSDNKSSSLGINASADFQHSFKREGELLTFSYRMDLNPGSSTGYSNYLNLKNIPFSLRDMYSHSTSHSDEHAFQLDYTTPLDSMQTLSTGLKYTYRINRSDNEEKTHAAGTTGDYVLDQDNSLLYRHRGDIMAGYLEYNFKLRSFSAKAGARYEYYNIDVKYPDGKRTDFGTHLQDLVPSVSVGYNLTESKMLKAGYNMRIGRPGINSLSPYVNHITPENISYGNPNLTSEHAHNMELGYSSFSQKLNLSVTASYSVTTDGITSYSFIDDAGIVNSTSNNFMHRKDVGLHLFLRGDLTKTTSFNIHGDGRYTDYKVNEIGSHNHGWSLHLFGGITQKLPLRFKISMWGGGATPETNLQGRGSKFYFYSLNLSRSFLKDDRLEVTLQANNFIGRYHYFKSETTTPDYHYYSKNTQDFQRFGIGLRYRLGSLKAKVKKAQRSLGGGGGKPGEEGEDREERGEQEK